MAYDPYLYWEDRAQTWVRENFFTASEWEHIRPYVSQSWKVLEVGCGDGRWAPYFWNYAGCDISHRLVAHCNINRPGHKFFQLNLETAYSLPAVMDTVFSYTCLEHVRPEAMGHVADLFEGKRLLLVEPAGESGVEHCFKHDYERILGVTKLKDFGQLTVYGRDV